MDDIVTRLRQFGDSNGLDAEAADEIERLRLELEEQQYWNSVLKEQVKYII